MAKFYDREARAELRRREIAPGAALLGLALLVLPVSGCGRLGAALVPAGGGQRGALASLGQGLLGNDARNLSPAARKRALLAEYRALEYNRAGQNVSWKSPDGSASGTVSPGLPYRVGEQNCRQYSHEWVLRGAARSARGSACRNADGSWTPLI